MPAYESTEEYLNSTQIGRQIIRIRENVSDALTAIGATGVTVPSGSNSDDLADLIGAIQSGGGTPSATAHAIRFEFDGNYSPVNITFYADSTFILDAIRATTPSTYDSKTVTLAQLDGVTWYSYDPSLIPLNTQLIDYTACKSGFAVGEDGNEEANEYANITDYTVIDPSMTFSYVAYRWWSMAFYAEDKTFIGVVQQSEYADTIDEYDMAHGTLTPARIPENAKYIRFTFAYDANADYISLIRTA